MCNGCGRNGICRSLTVPAYQICNVPIKFRIKIGDKSFTNIDLQRYLSRTNEQVMQIMCRDEKEVDLAKDFLYEKGFLDVMVFKIKVPECYDSWSFKKS